MLWKYKKCYQETNEDVSDPIKGMMAGSKSISTQITPSNGCNLLNLEENIFILKQNESIITGGDIVYIDSFGLSVFVGNGEYYKIKAIDTNEYIVRIESTGVISNISEICF